MGFNLDNNRLAGDRERKLVILANVVVKGAVSAPMKTNVGVDVATMLTIIRTTVGQRSWRSTTQFFIEKAIIDCRFFSILVVAGTLLGSVLWFLEGTFLVMKSYIQYFHSLFNLSDNGQIMHLLIESLDMFLVGTAMLVLGIGLHVMFVGGQSSIFRGSQLPSSHFFGIFCMKKISSWARLKSVTHAKSIIGYSIMLLLQVGMLEKFKSMPLVTGLDLACFTEAVFVSSAGLFILSKLNLDR